MLVAVTAPVLGTEAVRHTDALPQTTHQQLCTAQSNQNLRVLSTVDVQKKKGHSRNAL